MRFRLLTRRMILALALAAAIPSAYSGYGKIVQQVIAAAYTAFHDGLYVALYLSAGLVLAAGLLAFITLRPRPAAAGILTIRHVPSDREDGHPRSSGRRR